MSKRHRHRPAQDAPGADEPTSRLYGMWLERGQGWSWVCVDLPRALVERYATHISEPEIRGIALGQMVTRIEREAFE